MDFASGSEFVLLTLRIFARHANRRNGKELLPRKMRNTRKIKFLPHFVNFVWFVVKNPDSLLGHLDAASPR
jgi:hypothetical protein